MAILNSCLQGKDKGSVSGVAHYPCSADIKPRKYLIHNFRCSTFFNRCKHLKKRHAVTILVNSTSGLSLCRTEASVSVYLCEISRFPTRNVSSSAHWKLQATVTAQWRIHRLMLYAWHSVRQPSHPHAYTPSCLTTRWMPYCSAISGGLVRSDWYFCRWQLSLCS